MLCVSCSHPRTMPTRAMPTMTYKIITTQMDIHTTRQMVSTHHHHHLPNHTSRQFPCNLRRQSPSLAYPLSPYRTESSSLETLVPVSRISPIQLSSLIFYLAASRRSYTPIKTLGDGSFGTVLLCDWHGSLPPNTPLSPMQYGGGEKWAGKRLVAVKRMKKKWEGGWDECKRLKELEVRPSAFLLHPAHHLFSHYVQYHFTLASFPSTIFFSSLIPRNSISSLNPWKGIYTIL